MTRRISVYVDAEKYKILKSELAYQDRSVSEWVRSQIDEFLLKVVENRKKPSPPQPQEPTK